MSDGEVVVHVDYGCFEEDVIAEILARLPVKSLMRFRCVCKPWCTLISASYFVKRHLSYQERGITESPRKLIYMMFPPFALDCDALKNKEDYEALQAHFHHQSEVDYDDNHGQFAVTRLYFPVIKANRKSYYRVLYGACNGLVCVEDEVEGIMLWNPCTRDSKILPSPPQVNKPKFRRYLFGLGHDSVNDEYKVIRGLVCCSDGAKETMIQIFSLKTGLWRTVTDFDYVNLWRRWMGLFVNGALHWFYTLPEGGSRILSFDLGKEEFQKTVPLPYDGFFSDLFIHRNCLCVCTCPTGTNSINIWMMKEYGVKESWTQVVQFSLEYFKLRLPRHDYDEYIEPVCILENGLVLSIAMCYNVSLVVFSNLKEKTFKHSAHVAVDDGTLMETVMYRETLVSPGIHTIQNQL